YRTCRPPALVSPALLSGSGTTAGGSAHARCTSARSAAETPASKCTTARRWPSESKPLYSEVTTATATTSTSAATTTTTMRLGSGDLRTDTRPAYGSMAWRSEKGTGEEDP